MHALEWMLSGDTGVSSETILAATMGLKAPHPSVPLDVADFGRCFRLVRDVDLVRTRLPHVAMVYPMWAPYLERWDAMEQLYAAAEEESQRGAETARKLNLKALQALLDDAQRHIGKPPGPRLPDMFKVEDRHMEQALYHLRLAMQPEVPYRPDGDVRMVKDAYAMVQQDLNLAYGHLFEAIPGWMAKHGKALERKE